jgi:Mg2+/Co2+ transporter CorB
LAGVTLEFIGMAALLAASGFVSGSETALFSLNPNTQGFGRRPVDRLVRLLLQTEHRLLLTILIQPRRILRLWPPVLYWPLFYLVK